MQKRDQLLFIAVYMFFDQPLPLIVISYIFRWRPEPYLAAHRGGGRAVKAELSTNGAYVPPVDVTYVIFSCAGWCMCGTTTVASCKCAPLVCSLIYISDFVKKMFCNLCCKSLLMSFCTHLPFFLSGHMQKEEK